jgi:hypothetical protein
MTPVMFLTSGAIQSSPNGRASVRGHFAWIVLLSIALQSIRIADCSIKLWHDDWILIDENADGDKARDDPPVRRDEFDDDGKRRPSFAKTDAPDEVHTMVGDAVYWQRDEDGAQFAAVPTPPADDRKYDGNGESEVGVIYSADQHDTGAEPTRDAPPTPEPYVVRCENGRCYRVLRRRSRFDGGISRLDNDEDQLQRQENVALDQRPTLTEASSNDRSATDGKRLHR